MQPIISEITCSSWMNFFSSTSEGAMTLAVGTPSRTSSDAPNFFIELRSTSSSALSPERSSSLKALTYCTCCPTWSGS